MNTDYQNILITGASSGIGLETARQLSAPGRRLFLTSRSEEKLLRAVEGLSDRGAGVAHRAADLTHPSASTEVIAAALESMGGIDAVVHCAGCGLIRSLADTSDAEFIHVTNLNIRGTFLLAKEACRVMAEQKKGRFLTIPGILGKAPMRNASAYVASKYAVTGMIKSIALEYQRAGIQFSLFYFGGVDSPFWDDLDMKVQRDKMIPADVAAAHIVQAVDSPSHLVLNEMVLQPESHQM